MTDLRDQTALLDALTAKQREVLGMVADGMTSKEIARKLGVSESAVNQRIEVVRQRLGGRSRASIARLYRDTNSLVMTIPTSNSLTGKAIQLQALREFDQHLSAEGAEDFDAPADKSSGELQPSTLPPWLHGKSANLNRTFAVIALAIGMLAIALLTISLARTIADLGSAIG